MSTFLLSLVRTQFISEWETTDEKMPTFEKAYEVMLTRDVRIRHDTYRYVRLDICVLNHISQHVHFTV